VAEAAAGTVAAAAVATATRQLAHIRNAKVVETRRPAGAEAGRCALATAPPIPRHPDRAYPPSGPRL
jgi:hypothetical protein